MNRYRRRCGFDDNDLRRPVDRIQGLSGLLLLVVFLLVTPVVGVQAVQHARDSGVRAERHEAATLHRVDATVVNVKRSHGGREVTLTWIDGDGTPRSGHYRSQRGAQIGDHPKVWAGPRHGVTDLPPRTHARTVGDMATAGAATATATGLPLLGLYMLVRRRMDHRRYRAWDEAWASLDHRHRPA
ncbi:MAG: Rv1733c family protein [Spirillospora sp.]